MADENYADAQELRSFLGIKDDIDDDLLTLAVVTASRWIDEECNRRFWLDDLAVADVADPALARTYFAQFGDIVEVDDFDPNTEITVALDNTQSGSYGTTLAVTGDYLLLPLNAVASDRPCTRLQRLNACWPSSYRGLPTVRLTARWGWPAVPAPVKQACLILAKDFFSSKDAPFGVAGFGDFGAVRVRTNAYVEQLLAPFKLAPLVG